MGTWDTGPFDNDHAADFAWSVEACSGPEARHDLFVITFGTFMDTPDGAFAGSLAEGYELPCIMLETIASAAYVADAVTGRRDYTDTVYAKQRVTPAGPAGVHGDHYEFIPMGTPPEAVADAAILALTRCLRLMTRAAIGRAWSDSPESILRTLTDARR